jgi:indolepyruvate ferredoxin oxidoreductase beta subunit
METKIIICGLGGQGVVFLTRLLANTAMADGHAVMVSETHGMSQRGGSVLSHLKIDGNQAPLIQHGAADLLLALEVDEAVRHLTYLRPGGTAFVDAAQRLRPELDADIARLNLHVHCLPAGQMAIELGAPAVANVILAGFAAAHEVMPFSFATLRQALHDASGRHRDLNLAALEAGFRSVVSVQ